MKRSLQDAIMRLGGVLDRFFTSLKSRNPRTHTHTHTHTHTNTIQVMKRSLQDAIVRLGGVLERFFVQSLQNLNSMDYENVHGSYSESAAVAELIVDVEATLEPFRYLHMCQYTA